MWRPRLMPRTDKQDAVYKNPDNDPRGVCGDQTTRQPANKYSKGLYSVTVSWRDESSKDHATGVRIGEFREEKAVGTR